MELKSVVAVVVSVVVMEVSGVLLFLYKREQSLIMTSWPDMSKSIGVKKNAARKNVITWRLLCDFELELP